MGFRVAELGTLLLHIILQAVLNSFFFFVFVNLFIVWLCWVFLAA